MKERSKLIEKGVKEELANSLSAREAKELLQVLSLLQTSYTQASERKELLVAA